MVEDLMGVAALDDLAAMHHADPLGHFAHDAEIVGDEQHGHVELGLEIEEKLQDLRLDGHVERRGRLVGDEQVRLVGERHGDHHPLPLAAGKLMRVGGEATFRIVDADLGEEVDHPRSTHRARQPLMDAQHLGDLPLDRVQRVQRGHRLLEDHGNLVAAHMA